MLRIATTALLLAAAATPALAEAQAPDRGFGRANRDAPNGGERQEMRAARQEMRQSREQVRDSRADLAGDRRDYRQNLRDNAAPAQLRQDRQDIRDSRRDLANDRRDYRDDRRDFRDERRDVRGDIRNDWRNDRRDDRRNDWRDDRRGWNGNDRGAWNNRWRDDRRYDWQSYRTANRNIYRLPRYYAPRGYAYRRWSVGYRFDPWAYDRSYWINDPYQYRLPPAYGSYRWVRYYDDVALVDISSGLIADVLYSFFLR